MTITGHTGRKSCILHGLFFLLILFFAAAETHAEIISSSAYGYALDLPEGFSIADKDSNGKGYFFTHSLMPVQLIIKIYDSGEYKDASQALAGTFTKTGSQGDIAAVSWRNTDCVISQFTMENTALKNTQAGWALAVTLPSTSTQVVFMCYADQKIEFDCEQFILSVLDSLLIDRGSFYEAGPVTAFAYPGSSAQNITLDISGTKIATQIDAEDTEAAKFVIDREYAVLTLYAKQDNWKEAWQRYYRMIYRDSMGRLKKASFDIYNALYPLAQQKDSSSPDAALAQMLLTWAQNFDYVRDSATADFTSLPAAMTGTASDCDSRSLLLCVLLKNMGMDTALFISHEYSHAMMGIVLDKPGAIMELNGKKYLLGETTAHIDIGLVAQDMSDSTKWIPVELP